MFKWYVVNTYSGHENKVKNNILHRVDTLGQNRNIKEIVVPTQKEAVIKNDKKEMVEKRSLPGYVLINANLTEETWVAIKTTPGVSAFVGAAGEPTPLTKMEVDKLLGKPVSSRTSVSNFELGQQVRVIDGPMTDFTGEVSEINNEAEKLKVLISIFGRETPTELGFKQVEKVS